MISPLDEIVPFHLVVLILCKAALIKNASQSLILGRKGVTHGNEEREI
jgi:hypothetical protein